jgi:polar amino acid transport system substrate-binding protein
MNHRHRVRNLSLTLLSFWMTAAAAQPVPSDLEARAALTPTGTLRAAFLETNPMQGTVDAATGAVTGPAADVAYEIGRRLAVSVEMQPQPGVPAVIEAVRNGSADIGFLAYDTTRATQVAYTQAYVLGHNSYIVRADSPIRTLADADRPGTRIGVRERVAVALFLERTLENTDLVSLPLATTEQGAAELLVRGELDAYAANTERLAMAAALEPRIRIVDGSLMDAEQSIVVTLDNSIGLAWLNGFIDEVRDAGLLQASVDRHGLAGVDVAPHAQR